MKEKTVFFIGGGRITGIFLEALKNKNMFPKNVIVSDINEEVLKQLKLKFTGIQTTSNDLSKIAESDIVFVSLHPPVIIDIISKISNFIKNNTIIISLAPKIKISKLKEIIKNSNKIVHMIPNAPSIINSGYNPVAFSDNISGKEKNELISFFNIFGEYQEVNEDLLEAYAIISAMGPTYFWYQLYELQNLAISFGLNEIDAKKAIKLMLIGSIKTMNDSGLNPNEVMDLIPVKPLNEIEEQIKNTYKTKLTELYNKLKS